MYSVSRNKYALKNGRLKLRLITTSMVAIGFIVPLPFSTHFYPQTVAHAASTSNLEDIGNVNFGIFKPNPKNKSRLDYSIWNDALGKVVLDFGPSTRLRARKPAASVGTRFVKGHKSAYRLEGTRFTFEFITDDYRQGLTDYRRELQNIATEYDITRFPKREQLAFWLNLHNVAVLEKIALNYPVKRPEKIKLNVGNKKYSLDKAPFIEIMGRNISLEDIRKNIVFEYWDNPNVIYGFFQGEIGSPSLQQYAYSSETVDIQLNQNADDFVNSLRGFNLGSSTKNVSAIYEEAAPYFFKNWQTDIQSHLLRYANETVKAELAKPYPFKIDNYDNMIADLSGGLRLGSSGAPTNNSGLSFEMRRVLGEVREKKEYLRRRNLIQNKKGYVIIEDLEPEDYLTESAP